MEMTVIEWSDVNDKFIDWQKDRVAEIISEGVKKNFSYHLIVENIYSFFDKPSGFPFNFQNILEGKISKKEWDNYWEGQNGQDD